MLDAVQLVQKFELGQGKRGVVSREFKVKLHQCQKRQDNLCMLKTCISNEVFHAQFVVLRAVRPSKQSHKIKHRLRISALILKKRKIGVEMSLAQFRSVMLNQKADVYVRRRRPPESLMEVNMHGR